MSKKPYAKPTLIKLDKLTAAPLPVAPPKE
jgi:hypothetical protein